MKLRKRSRNKGHGPTLFEQSVSIRRDRGMIVNEWTLIDAAIMKNTPPHADIGRKH